MMRALPLLLFFATLAGCGDKGQQGGSQQSGSNAASNDGIECAMDGAADFERTCTLEHSGAGGHILTLKAADGGFHRLLVTNDGRGVVAADGALPAKVTILANNSIEVAIGRDRYRLPATVHARR
jgi:hypothetical protein